MLSNSSNIISAYLALIDDSDPATAVSVWFPDLPGCFSAGDSVEEALLNAEEALALHLFGLEAEGLPVPKPRSVQTLKADPDTAADMAAHMIALIPHRPHRAAAE